MPLYDYCCQECHHTFEVRRQMADTSPPPTCPECGSETQKVISSPASVINWHDNESVHASTRFRPKVTNPTLRGR